MSARRAQYKLSHLDVARADGKWSTEDVSSLEATHRPTLVEIVRYHNAVNKAIAKARDNGQ